MGSLIQQSSAVGGAAGSKTETFSAAGAGHLLVLVCATNENAGADNITTPAGWTLLGTFRQGTTTVNMAVFGKIAAGGETSQTVTTSAALQRMQTWFGEFSGYTLSLDGAISTAGNTAAVLQADTGTKTPGASGRLYLGVVAVKNRPASGLTEVGGMTAATVNNETVGVSAQALTLGVYYDLARGTAAREQPTWTTTSAAFGGMGLLLVQASGLIAATFSSTGSGTSTFSAIRIGPPDATVTVNRSSVLLASSTMELHALHVQNSIRGKPNGNGAHNARALTAALASCNAIFDGHANHIGMPAGGGWQMIDPFPFGGITVGAQGSGATLNIDNGAHFPAGGSTGMIAKVYDTRAGTTFTFTGVTTNTLTGCSGLPASIPAGSPVLLYQFTANGATDRPLLFDNQQSLSVKELFDSLTATKRTLVLHGASTWMQGQTTMLFPPLRVYFKAWAYACAEIVAQFAANGTPITHVGVWNEFKGYANHVGPGNQGGSGTLQSGQTGVLIPTDAGAGAAVDSNLGASGNLGNNGTEWLAYTMMYNEVWDAFKFHPNSAVNTVKVMGPHDNIGSVGVGTGFDHTYPFGTFDGTLQASGFKNGTHVPSSNLDRDRLCYFLDYATGYDAITLDYSIVDNGIPGDANEAFVYANYQATRDAVRQVKSVLANRAGLSVAKRAAPVNFIEYYADVNLARVSFQSVPSGGGFTDLQQGYMEGALLRCMVEEGVNFAYRWAPMGDDTTGQMWNKGSYFLTTQIADAGATRNASATAGETSPPNLPGATLPAYDSAKVIHDAFPVGTKIHPTSCTDASGKIFAIASPTKTVIGNGYSTGKNVLAEGTVVAIPAYSFVAVNAAAGELVGAVPI